MRAPTYLRLLLSIFGLAILGCACASESQQVATMLQEEYLDPIGRAMAGGKKEDVKALCRSASLALDKGTVRKWVLTGGRAKAIAGRIEAACRSEEERAEAVRSRTKSQFPCYLLWDENPHNDPPERTQISMINSLDSGRLMPPVPPRTRCLVLRTSHQRLGNRTCWRNVRTKAGMEAWVPCFAVKCD